MAVHHKSPPLTCSADCHGIAWAAKAHVQYSGVLLGHGHTCHIPQHSNAGVQSSHIALITGTAVVPPQAKEGSTVPERGGLRPYRLLLVEQGARHVRVQLHIRRRVLDDLRLH